MPTLEFTKDELVECMSGIGRVAYLVGHKESLKGLSPIFKKLHKLCEDNQIDIDEEVRKRREKELKSIKKNIDDVLNFIFDKEEIKND